MGKELEAIGIEREFSVPKPLTIYFGHCRNNELLSLQFKIKRLSTFSQQKYFLKVSTMLNETLYGFMHGRCAELVRKIAA